MNESAFVFGSHSLVGILCEPAAAQGLAVIFVNAGSTHRSGPNRLYAILARRLAARGHLSMRFDIAGIGDSPSAGGIGKFRDYAARQVREAMDYLAKTKDCWGFVIIGLCGGADIAFDAAAADERARGLILVNGAFVDGDAFADLYHTASRRTANRFYAARMLSPRRWWRFLTFQSRFWKRLRHHKESSTPTSLACGRPTAEMSSAGSRLKWELLAQRRANVLLIYSEGSIFWDIYKAANKEFLKTAYPAESLTVAFHKNADHTFTLLSAQERLTIQIEQWLETIPTDESRCAGAAVGART